MQTSTSSLRPLASITTALRIVWLAMLASIVVLAVVAEFTAQAAQRPEAIFFEAITAVATGIVIARFVLRRKLLGDAALLLAQEPNSGLGLRQWHAGHVVSYALSEAVALFGFTLRFVGFTLREVAPFYIAGLAMMFFSAPKAQPDMGSPS